MFGGNNTTIKKNMKKQVFSQYFVSKIMVKT